MSVANSFIGFLVAAEKPVPCIFVVLDDEKAKTLKVMKKLSQYIKNIYPVIITDCSDAETRKFFTEFTGGNEKQIFYIERSGPALSGLLFVVPL